MIVLCWDLLSSWTVRTFAISAFDPLHEHTSSLFVSVSVFYMYICTALLQFCEDPSPNPYIYIAPVPGLDTRFDKLLFTKIKLNEQQMQFS